MRPKAFKVWFRYLVSSQLFNRERWVTYILRPLSSFLSLTPKARFHGIGMHLLKREQALD